MAVPSSQAHAPSDDGNFDCWFYGNMTVRKLRRYIEFATLNPEEDDRSVVNLANIAPLPNLPGGDGEGQRLDPGANLTVAMHQHVHEYPHFDSRALIVVIAYCCVFFGAVVGNVTVFVNLFRSRRRKSRISFLIIHLTIADLIVTFIMIPFEIAWRLTVQWLGGNIACKVLLFFRAFGLYLSSNVLICISLDRYFAVVHPLMVTNKRNRNKWMLYGAWLASTFSALPQLFIFHVGKHPHFANFTQCVSFDYFTSPRHEFLYNIACLTMMYFLPLMIIVVAYTSILGKMWHKARRTKADEEVAQGRNSPLQADCLVPNEKRSGWRGGSNVKVSNIGETTFSQERVHLRKHREHVVLRRSDMKCIERARIRTLNMTVVIVIVFLVCWTPYVVMAMWYMFDRDSAQKVPILLQDGLFMMAVSNSCMNPLVYGRYTMRTVVGGDDPRRVASYWCLCRCFPCTYREPKRNVMIVEPRITNKRRLYADCLAHPMVDFTADDNNKELMCRADARLGSRSVADGAGDDDSADVATPIASSRQQRSGDARMSWEQRHERSSERSEPSGRSRSPKSSKSSKSSKSFKSCNSGESSGRQTHTSANLKGILRN